MDAEAREPAPAPEPAAGPGAERQARRGPAPIASFDHDGSDESSPESKQTFRLPEIREQEAGATAAAGARGEGAAGAGSGAGDESAGSWLTAPGEGRARSHSTPAVAPRIDISRASSSSHQDSRDSSPELALFAGDAPEGREQRLELGFREDGALDLRSSTEELSFLEPAPAPRPGPALPPAPPPSQPPAPAAPPDRRHSRKDSQSSEAALLVVSGRTSRLSSVGSACSAQSGVSRLSRLSVVSGVSRSPSPHRMLLETSFCGPKPIESDPEACAAAVADRILEIVGLGGEVEPPVPVPVPAPVPAPSPASPPAAPVDARDRREVRTEVRVEVSGGAAGAGATRVTRQPALALSPVMAPAPKAPDPEKIEKETKNRARNEERKARPRVRREPSEPEVYKSTNKSKDIIRIKLRPDEEEEEEGGAVARAPSTLALDAPAPAPPGPAPPSPALSRRRSPSPLGPPSVSRKSSFCSLFKSRETIGSPDSPQAQEALRRKRSLTEGRARSKSRDRSTTPTSSKIRGSVLSLFRTPRKSATASSPGSRATSPAPAPLYPSAPSDPRRAQQDKLKYYEEAKNGIIHIPLRTPPEERGASASGRRSSGAEPGPAGAAAAPEAPRPASAPQPRCAADRAPPACRAPPVLRTVLPDGSIIIPLHSPTERVPETEFPPPIQPKDPTPPEPEPEPRPISRRDDFEPAPIRPETGQSSIPSPETVAVEPAREPRPTEPEPAASPPEQPRPEVTSERRKERFVFTTHVGSRDQVFSTQFSITKTPSITSEISGSFPSFENGELRDSHIASEPARSPPEPPEPPRDSSESEPSSEAAPPQAGNDVERRGLVVQESFEEELPYVPTTLPQERSVVVPMVPVRERGGVLVRSVQRPRAAPVPSSAPAPRSAPPPAPATASADKLRIKLPRRPRVSSAPRPTRERTRSSGGGGDSGGENRVKQEWIDFEEVPERRKQPKRIQTLPGGAGGGGGGGASGSGDVVFSYVEPEHCRCECHHEDQLPLLQDDMHASRISSSSAECGEGEGEGEEEGEGAGEGAFSADFDLRHDAHAHTSAGSRARL